MTFAGRLLAIALLSGFGCGGKKSGAVEEALDPCGGIPCLPELTDWACPAGWDAAPAFTHDDPPLPMQPFTACRPPAQVDCAAGQVQWLGASACSQLGTACPTGDFLDEEAVRAQAPGFHGSIIHVSPDATTGGDGSAASPYPQVGLALSVANAGDIIHLGRGVHPQPVSLSKAVALVGACVSDTRIASATPDDQAMTLQLVGQGGGMRVANLTVGGGRQGIGIWSTGPPAVISGVEITGAANLGIGVFGGTAELEEVVVRDTTPDDTNNGGWGAVFMQGADVLVRGAVFERVLFAGLAAYDAGTSVDMERIVIRDTGSNRGNLSFGGAVHATDGASLTIRNALFAGNRSSCVQIHEPGTFAALTDVMIRDMLPKERDDTGGEGLYVGFGATATLSRVQIEGAYLRGIAAERAGTFVSLSDVVVRDTRPEIATDRQGLGIQVHDDAVVSGQRLLLERNHFSGIVAQNEGTQVDLTDVAIRDTEAHPTDLQGGWGVFAGYGAQLSAARMLLSGNRDAGLNIGRPGTIVSLVDLIVQDTRANAANAKFGRGLAAQDGCTVTLLGGLFRHNLDVSVSAYGQGVFVSLADVVIEDTRTRACAEIPEGEPRSCVIDGVPYGSGTGVAAVEQALVQLRDFEISGNALAGVQVTRDAGIWAADGAIHDNLIGLNVQVPGFDYGQIDTSVEIYDNGTDLDTADLPVPDPLEGI